MQSAPNHMRRRPQIETRLGTVVVRVAMRVNQCMYQGENKSGKRTRFPLSPTFVPMRGACRAQL